MDATTNALSEEKETSKKTRRAEQTVLIVDSSEETRDVLSTALERRGVKTFSTALPRRGAALARKNRPDVVVFDVETEWIAPRQAIDSFARDAELANTPIVAIGSAKIEIPAEEGEFVVKPYHFAPLLQKIEEALAAAENRVRNRNATDFE